MSERDRPVEIFVIEDNDDDAELMLLALKRHRLVNTVRRVSNGSEALAELLGTDDVEPVTLPYVIFLDLRMPGSNGLDVLRTLRANSRTRSVPIVVMTSSNQDRDIAAAYDLGANSYVVKPVNFERFAETISQLGLYWTVHNRPPLA